MEKLFLRGALLCLLFCSGQSFAQKHVIGSHNAGFFSAFFGVLHHLYWCEKTGNIPVVYWGKESFYWQKEGYNGSFNAWEYFFEPVSSETASAHEPRDMRYWIDEFIFCFDLMDNKKIVLANRLINKYVRIKAPISAKLESFFDKKMAGKKTIGIHLRGTDKYTEVKVVDTMLILKRANKEAQLLGECQFFIATDEYRLLALAKKY
jgi:hypothetical protein